METSRASSTTPRKHPGPDAYKGKKCVVLGSNNSAHDICAALWEHGADVTMVQRSSTHIAPSDTLMELALGGLYSEQAVKNGMTTDKADLIFASVPYKIMHAFQIPVYDEMKKRDADLLCAAGEGRLHARLRRRRLGPVHEVPAPRLGLLHRRRRLRAGGQRQHQAESGVNIERINPTGGGADRRQRAAGRPDRLRHRLRLDERLGGRPDLAEVADKVGKCWGLGSDTPRTRAPGRASCATCGSPPSRPHLWFHGGNLHQSRHYSQFLSLQLKARYGRHADAGLRAGAGAPQALSGRPPIVMLPG
jgi:putative flavoprotein involved in K+ transport